MGNVWVSEDTWIGGIINHGSTMISSIENIIDERCCLWEKWTISLRRRCSIPLDKETLKDLIRETSRLNNPGAYRHNLVRIQRKRTPAIKPSQKEF
jgi:hypothetical protein